jgi:arginase
MSVSLVVLRCRTSDRTPGGGAGAQALGRALGERLGVEPRIVGSPGDPRPARFDDDLRDSRGCILEAGGQVEDALARGAFPLLLASDCSICLTTLAAVDRHVPGAWFVWLDAHGDFNTPDTTPSDFLGGMCLAAACGRWDAGLDVAPVDPARVVMCGVRDLDSGERAELDFAGIGVLGASELPDRLRGEHVYVHLDLDVLDPDVLPSQFPAPRGMSANGLGTLLTGLAGAAQVVGVEITALEAADHAGLVGSIVEPLLAVAG